MKEYLSSLISHGKQWHLKKSKIDDELMTQILNLTKHCRNNISERVYWILNDIQDYPICLECNKQFIPRFYGLKNAYRDSKFCSLKCVANNNLVQEQIKETNKERYGVEFVQQNKEINQKSKNTLFQNYNVTSTLCINSEKYNQSKIPDSIEILFSISEIKKVLQENSKKFNSELLKSIIFYTRKCRDKLNERIYWILNDIEDYPNCTQCRKTVSTSFLWIKNWV